MQPYTNPSSIKEVAVRYLRDVVGNTNAEFRDGQWESIEHAISGNRVLVVQRTGWGKTMVYTIATKLKREKGEGPSLMISPLLALMRNQELAADALNLNARRLTGDNFHAWKEIKEELDNDEVDILMITPERLANPSFIENTLPRIANGLGMLIIDEAHCISDWGHDFRPDYRRIRRVQKMIPQGAAIVATTATANNRVVEDVREQLGENILISRGSLIRRSLHLHNLIMDDPATRLAWVAQAVERLPGSGIIYVLTRRDAERVSGWLQNMGIDAHAYSGSTDDRKKLEEGLLQNQLKVLVATIALGMGFDKPDITFIIHYQRPGSVVHYYQQVGRAGRGIKDAYGFLLWGQEDERIANFFLKNAYPPQDEIDQVLNVLQDAQNGLTITEILLQVNLKESRIEKILKLASLESPAPAFKKNNTWYASPNVHGFEIPPELIARLYRIRKREQAEMREYMEHDGCLMAFLQRALDDPTAQNCGRCHNCNPKPSFSPDLEIVQQARQFLKARKFYIYPQKSWPMPQLSDHPIHETYRIKEEYLASFGFALCEVYDGGLGDHIVQEKKNDRMYSDSVVIKFISMLKRSVHNFSRLQCITYIPPYNRDEQHVPALAKKVADKLGIRLVHAVSRIGTESRQRELKNSVLRAQNVANAFVIDRSCPVPTLLIDDVTVSGWTLTTVAALLRYNDCPRVVPGTLIQHNLPY